MEQEKQKLMIDCDTVVVSVIEYAKSEGISLQGAYKRIQRNKVKWVKIGSSIFIKL